MEELVWAKSVKYREYGCNMSYVFSLASHTFKDKERFVDLLRSLLFGTLFQWACILDFTQCISISTFLQFAIFRSWFICFYLFSGLFIIVNTMILYINKILITYPQKKKKIKRHEQGYLQILCFLVFNFWIYFDWTIYFILITAITVMYFYLSIYF